MFPADKFTRREFECHCGCGTDTVDAELLNVLNKLRADLGSPVVVVSGHRCTKHNSNTGGAKYSQHLSGKAADIQVTGIPPKDVYKYLDEAYPNKYGIGKYDSFTHIDVRRTKTRW